MHLDWLHFKLTWVQCHSFQGFPDCVCNMQQSSLHCPLEQLKVLVKVIFSLIQQNISLWYFWVKDWQYLSSLYATDFLVSKTLVPSCWIQYFVRHSYVPVLYKAMCGSHIRLSYPLATNTWLRHSWSWYHNNHYICWSCSKNDVL